jgi:hypothetical protein
MVSREDITNLYELLATLDIDTGHYESLSDAIETLNQNQLAMESTAMILRDIRPHIMFSPYNFRTKVDDCLDILEGKSIINILD